MFGRRRNIVCLLIGLMAGLCGCSSRALDEAQAVVAQADSLWHIGQTYGIDEGDSASLAQAYETLKKQSAVSRQLSEVFPFVPCTSSLCTYAHACYHYGRLLRQKDDPVSAMQVFIDATHSRTRDYHILGRVYSNMGSICHLANEFTLSYDMYQRSADCFLKNGDTLNYYYAMNDMTYELAEQGKIDSCFYITANIKKHYPNDSMLIAYCFITQAQACLKCQQYDSTVSYARQSRCYLSSLSSSMLQLAQAYSHLGRNDSAVHYAQQVLEISHALGDINNALYILTNDDNTKDLEAVRQTAADRSDTQKLLEIRRSKMSQAVQLLEQDLARKPDWKWLMGIIGTLVVTGCIMYVYIKRKRHQHKLLSQQVEDLTTINNAAKQQHEQIIQEYDSFKHNKIAQIEQNCIVFSKSEDFPNNISWKEYSAMCKIIDNNFRMLTTKLQSIYHLSEREIRLCVLVLLGISNSEQLAEMLFYSISGIRNFKNRTAKKVGTNSVNLRQTLMNIIVGELQETGK